MTRLRRVEIDSSDSRSIEAIDLVLLEAESAVLGISRSIGSVTLTSVCVIRDILWTGV